MFDGLFLVFFVLQGDPGITGFKGEAGPKGELVSLISFEFINRFETYFSHIMMTQPTFIEVIESTFQSIHFLAYLNRL